MYTKAILMLMAVLFILPMTATAKVNMKPKTPAEWREYLNYRRDQTLEDLYKLRPYARAEIMGAKGYAVFTSFNVNVVFASMSGGRGILHENGLLGGKDIYMRMAQGGLGLGLGVKDFRAVFIFDNKEVLDRFQSGSWSLGAEADAAVKGGGEGASTSGAITVAPGLRVYQLTENGLALQATIHGTKYWRDAFVNGDK